jgi:two-component system phosphate regulon sensor histidine kinase PhoR
VLIRISDDGEGIDKQNIPRLFERFYRVNQSGSRSEGGSGLGLIVKHIIEVHKEKIYESELGVGSEFSLHLKRQKKIFNKSLMRSAVFVLLNPQFCSITNMHF